MNVIVVGAGEVGFHIAQRLSTEGHAVTVIEKSREKEQLIKAKLDALVVRGSGANAEVLERAGVKNAQLFIAVSDQDEVNLVACLLAREHGALRTIARMKSLEYTTEEWEGNARRLGIDLLINPQKALAEEICRFVTYTAASEAAEFAEGRVVFLGYLIGPASPLVGLTLKDLAAIRGLYRMVVTAIARKRRTLVPRGDDVIEVGDIVYFVCVKRDLPAINYLFQFEKRPVESVFVLGGQPVGEALAARLAAQGLRVKLIDPDREVCAQLAERLENVPVLHTEGTDVDTLQNEGIEDCDVFIAVTGDDQTNILCSLLAKSHGAKRAIAAVDRHEFVALAPSLGVDACISPRMATASAVLKYVRPSAFASLAAIEHSNSEVFEVVLPPESGLVGRPLREIDTPEGAIIALIVRGEELVLPAGDDRLEPGDHVIVFALPEAITRVERFFS